jgi:hypothetical protein
MTNKENYSMHIKVKGTLKIRFFFMSPLPLALEINEELNLIKISIRKYYKTLKT